MNFQAINPHPKRQKVVFYLQIIVVAGLIMIVMGTMQWAQAATTQIGPQAFLTGYTVSVDIHAEAGGGLIAIARTFDIRVDDSMLNLAFISIADNAKISAIEVHDNALGCME